MGASAFQYIKEKDSSVCVGITVSGIETGELVKRIKYVLITK